MTIIVKQRPKTAIRAVTKAVLRILHLHSFNEVVNINVTDYCQESFVLLLRKPLRIMLAASFSF